MKKTLALMLLILLMAGCSITIDVDEDGVDIDTDDEVVEEEVADDEVVEEELADSAIDFDNIEVGDKVGAMTVTEIANPMESGNVEIAEGFEVPGLAEWNAVIDFDGEVELTGEYTYYDSETGFFGDWVCITSLDEESLAKLPLPASFTSPRNYMCFSNKEEAKEMLGITADEEVTGEITFIIDWYQYVGMEIEAWNLANLVEVL